MKSVLIIGIGHFGRHLAERMLELGNDVMIMDSDAEIIDELAPQFTNAQIGDCTNINVLRSMGINNFDICFVTIGDNFQSSLEITSLLKELGAKRVISKANRDIQAKFLLRNGADEIVYPERDIADKLALRCSSDNIFDYIELTKEYSIFNIPVLESWEGKSISQLNIRRKYRVNILAVKRGEEIHPLPGADYVFMPGDHIMAMATHQDILKIVD